MDSPARPDSPYANLLEPPALIAQFIAHPPQDFSAAIATSGAPYFVAKFDLLTTLEPALKRRVTALPLHRLWSRWLRPVTTFVGTTVTEYAPLPAAASARELVVSLRGELAMRQAFTILKDLPQDSPLLDAADNAHAHDIAQACEEAGFVLLEGQALAYVKIDFASTGEYLARLSAGARKDIRRKLRMAQNLEYETIPAGDARFRDAAVREEFHALFRQVYDQSDIHFDLLTQDFFDAILQDATSGGLVFVYRHQDRMVGFNLCYATGGKLIDKYVGFLYPQARELNLYFISWMRNLDYAIAQGLNYYVAGWTDPEIKRHLGASFTFTRHAVFARNRVLRAILRRVSNWFESDAHTLQRHE